MEAKPAGKNHVRLYHIESQPHDYDLCCVCSECYARTQRLISHYWSVAPTVQTYTRRLLGKYHEPEDVTEQVFHPELALARYRELEALLRLELLCHPDWQEQRAQGNYEWLRTNTYFIEQAILLNIITQNGYAIVDCEDEETGNTITKIVKQEKQPC